MSNGSHHPANGSGSADFPERSAGAERARSCDPDERPIEDEAERKARSFVRGTGAVFQVVGIFLLFGACCVWPVTGGASGGAPSPADAPRETAAEPSEFGRSSVGRPALPLVLLAVTLVGGFACAACGVGLQAERLGAGRIAALVAGLQALGLFAVAIAEVAGQGASVRALLAGGLAVLSAFLFLVAFESGRLLRRFPPPPDLGEATPEFMEEYRRKRLERLQNYDP